MNSKRIFIRSAVQISMQSPLSEKWMTEPVFWKEEFVKAQDPNFRDFIPVNESRRMGKLLKRAVVTAQQALTEAGTEHPEAIITGTCYGSMEYTEKFLRQMTDNHEELLSPTFFMQSTHNTVSSAIAIRTKTTAYNTTYSHGAMSFEWTLLDAWMQMHLDKIDTALVGGQDEMTENFYEMLCTRGIVGKEGMAPCGEVSMEMFLTTTNSPDNLCEMTGLKIMHLPTIAQLRSEIDKLLMQADLSLEKLDAVMTGVNGNRDNDKLYQEILEKLLPNIPRLHYKHLFGEAPTASAYGVYAAAHCLHTATVPEILLEDRKQPKPQELHSVLIVNCTRDKDVSLILLRKP